MSYKPLSKRQKELITVFFHLQKEMKKNKMVLDEYDGEIRVKRYINRTSAMTEEIMDYFN